MRDPITSHLMEPVFSEIILEKHKVTYYYCKESGLLKTETPYWLSEAYQEAISDLDVGLVRRNLKNSSILGVILACLSIKEGKFLDIAGGYGLLSRLMRDKGFNCYTTDKYCQNIFAKGLEPNDQFKADSLFAFEVLEHIEDPLKFISSMFDKYGTKTIIFSTLTFEDSIPPRNWWYYAFESGQHITFYQPKTLALLADRLDCKYYKLDAEFHIISDRDISYFNRLILLNNPLRRLYSIYLRLQKKIRNVLTD